MFTAMKFDGSVLHLLDQRRLPEAEIWFKCPDVESVASAIENMVVRGAPAIADAAAFALAMSASERARLPGIWADDLTVFETEVTRLSMTRPTAVNLFKVLEQFRRVVLALAPATLRVQVARLFVELAHRIYDEDLATCYAIGEHGLDLVHVADGATLRILTHCNTGSLATAGYGTALGVIRSLHACGRVAMVYVDETRPFLQGARLTAYELQAEGIPYRVICDSAAAYLMQRRDVDMVIVGADRIAANGDTANKIGTYGLAVLARHHELPFFVAAPLSTFDNSLSSGSEIGIEERSADELRLSAGKQMTPRDAPVFNPAFDVTPAPLVSGIITERGIIRLPTREKIAAIFGETFLCS